MTEAKTVEQFDFVCQIEEGLVSVGEITFGAIKPDSLTSEFIAGVYKLCNQARSKEFREIAKEYGDGNWMMILAELSSSLLHLQYHLAFKTLDGYRIPFEAAQALMFQSVPVTTVMEYLRIMKEEIRNKVPEQARKELQITYDKSNRTVHLGSTSTQLTKDELAIWFEHLFNATDFTPFSAAVSENPTMLEGSNVSTLNKQLCKLIAADLIETAGVRGQRIKPKYERINNDR